MLHISGNEWVGFLLFRFPHLRLFSRRAPFLAPLILVAGITIGSASMLASLAAVVFGISELSRTRVSVAGLCCILGVGVGFAFGLNATPRWIEGMIFGYSVAAVMVFGVVLAIIAWRDF